VFSHLTDSGFTLGEGAAFGTHWLLYRHAPSVAHAPGSLLVSAWAAPPAGTDDSARGVATERDLADDGVFTGTDIVALYVKYLGTLCCTPILARTTDISSPSVCRSFLPLLRPPAAACASARESASGLYWLAATPLLCRPNSLPAARAPLTPQWASLATALRGTLKWRRCRGKKKQQKKNNKFAGRECSHSVCSLSKHRECILEREQLRCLRPIWACFLRRRSLPRHAPPRRQPRRPLPRFAACSRSIRLDSCFQHLECGGASMRESAGNNRRVW
jgi:hypothetical protein